MISKLVLLGLILGTLFSCRAYHSTYSTSNNHPLEVTFLEENLQEIYFYHVVAYKHELNGHKQKQQTALAQSKKIEQKILAEFRRAHYQRKKEIKNQVQQFAAVSTLHGQTMIELALEINLKFPTSSLSNTVIEKQLLALEKTPEFQVFENNIEHLSYMLETKRRL